MVQGVSTLELRLGRGGQNEGTLWFGYFVGGVVSEGSQRRAQNASSTGSISGEVTDASGAAVVGATVTAVDEATGVKLTAKTNGTGFYSFPSLNWRPPPSKCLPIGQRKTATRVFGTAPV